MPACLQRISKDTRPPTQMEIFNVAIQTDSANPGHMSIKRLRKISKGIIECINK
jgi:hypothetical protein